MPIFFCKLFISIVFLDLVTVVYCVLTYFQRNTNKNQIKFFYFIILEGTLLSNTLEKIRHNI